MLTGTLPFSRLVKLDLMCAPCVTDTALKRLARFVLSLAGAGVHSIVMSDASRPLDAAGDRRAAADLLPLVYDELRKLAAARMAAEPPGHTLDATALVHEAYLRLVGDQQFDGRGHFFAAAAEAMRRILVDHARRHEADKRGGGRRRVPLGEVHRVADSPAGLLALDDALDRLAAEYPRKAELVKLRFFAGLTAGRRPRSWASPGHGRPVLGVRPGLAVRGTRGRDNSAGRVRGRGRVLRMEWDARPRR